MTIESSPTVESKEQTEDTKETAENEVTETLATETSEAPTVESQEEKETSADVVEKKKQEAVVGEEQNLKRKEIVEPPINKISPRATVHFPEATYQIGFVSEEGTLVAPENFSITYDYINWEQNNYLNRFTSSIITPSVEVPNVNGLKRIVLPVANIVQTNYPARAMQAAYRGTAPTNFSISLPKYYENLSLYNKNGELNQEFPLPLPRSWDHTATSSSMGIETAKLYLNVKKRADGTYTFYAESGYTTTNLKWPSLMSRMVGTVLDDKFFAFLLDEPVYYHLTNRKVTESFKNTVGATIPAPPNFEEGRKTKIDSNDYTFKQSGTLPKSYKGTDGKTYVLKGWYKGKTKPSTLRTDAPSYKVTYDGNDDLNVVYEEVKTKAYTLPSKEISFGYVDEKGGLVNPADFTIEAELGESNETETTVLSKIYGTNDASNMLKKLAIPGKSYTIPEGGIKTYGTRYVNHTIPKYYKAMSITPTATYTGDKTKYPVADEVRKSIEAPNNIASTVSGTTAYSLSTNGIVFGTRRSIWTWDSNKTSYAMGIYSGVVGNNYNLATPDKTVYYYLENRRVTENFVDSTGTKITPPPSFTQGKQTVIDSDNFTYTQEGSLPYIYKVNNKPYVLKGWYKGKAKPAKLNQISTDKRNISYPVSYDDQDDVTVVYDEIKLGDKTIQFGFVDEQGKYIPPTSKFNVSTDVGVVKDATYTKLQTVNSTVKGNYLSLTIPAYDPTGGLSQGQIYYGTLNSIVTIPKYYKTPTLTPSSNYQGTTYPEVTGVWDFHNGTTNVYSPSRLSLTPVSNSQTNYQVQRVWWANEATKTLFTSLYKMSYNSPSDTAVGLAEYYATGTVNYYLENRRVTENFVDASGAKLPSAPTGFTQGKQTAIDSDAYTFKQSGTLPESYKGADGKTYIFKGWYRGKTKPATLETTKTPTYPVTYDDNDDLNVVYEEGVPAVEASLKGIATIIPSGGNQLWRMTIKNTGTAPLTSLKFKPTVNWSKGLMRPAQLSVRLGTAAAKNIPVTAETWSQGVDLGTEIPVGATATVAMSTVATGNPMEVLQAEVALSGNMPTTTVSDTVRIQGSDQEVTDPVSEGFISTPTFDFGTVNISSQTQQHGLKKAADYYGNGTRNPFLRIKKSQPNWSLTAQLSPLKSTKDSLPTATKLLLGKAPVSKVDNYNLPTELMSPVGTTAALSLMSDNSATTVVANNQYTGNNVYHLDFAFNNIKLEVPANQGTKGEQYNATVTWNLVTGP
ncbi:WxL domain-containing protein [Enterococcus faecalis]|uniref:WxL domain-containing protein n=1 Tax=Enterococcus faecalis TaxID=1351 RepID=UPI003CC5B9DB